MRRSLVLVVLLGLAGASVAAVFAVQAIESQGSPVGTPTVSYAFSPNDDNVRDTATIGFHLRRRDHVTVSIRSRDGAQVRELATNKPERGAVRLAWDGRDDNGKRLPEGSYFLRIALADLHRRFDVRSPIRLDLTPPHISSVVLDTSRVATLGVIRAHVRVRDAVAPRVLELNGRPLETRRIRRTRREIARHTYTRFRISAALPADTKLADLTALRFVAVDRAGNRATRAATEIPTNR